MTLGQTVPQTRMSTWFCVFVCEYIWQTDFSKLRICWPVTVFEKSQWRIECHLLCHMPTQSFFFKSIVFFQNVRILPGCKSLPSVQGMSAQLNHAWVSWKTNQKNCTLTSKLFVLLFLLLLLFFPTKYFLWFWWRRQHTSEIFNQNC